MGRTPLRPARITGRLIAILLVMAVPILLAQAGFYYLRYTERQSEILRANLDIARATGVAFDAYIRDVLHQELAIGVDLTSPPRPAQEASQHLTSFVGQYRSLREFFWLDPAGIVLASSNPQLLGVDASQRDYFQAISHGRETAVSELLQALVGGDHVVVVARGIRDNSGTLQGIVGATVLADRLGVVALPLELSGGTAIRIVDNIGRLVYRRPEVSLNWEERMLLPADRLVSQALNGEEASGSYVSSLTPEERMGSVAPLRSIGWAVASSVPVSEAMGPVLQDILLQLAIFVVVVSASSLIALAVARSISRPVARLEEQARRLANGEFTAGVQPGGPEEIDRLARSFNWMATQIQDRTAHLEASIKELEAFSYSVSHDLRTPLRGIDGFSQALLEDYEDKLDEQGRNYLNRVRAASQKMGRLIDDILMLSRVTRREMRRQKVNLSSLVDRLARELRKNEPERRVDFVIQPSILVQGDPDLLKIALDNLVNNAWKFTSTRSSGKIEFGTLQQDGKQTYFVRDNGVGFDMTYADKLFGAFQRLHAAEDFPGTGIGLATVQRIIRRHGGRVWAEAQIDQGATFYFSLSE